MPLRPFHMVLGVVLLALALAMPAGPAMAQASEPAPADPAGEFSPEQVDALIATLEDDQRRADLVAQLRLLLTTEETAEQPLLESFGDSFIGSMSLWMSRIGQELEETWDAFVSIPRIFNWLGGQVGDEDSRARWAAILSGLATVLGTGIAAFLVVSLLMRPLNRRLDRAPAGNGANRVLLLLGRVLISFVPLIGFGVGAFGAFSLFSPNWQTRIIGLALINALLVVGVIAAVTRRLLEPRDADRRLFSISDETAGYLFGWVRLFTVIAVIGYVTNEVWLSLGLPLGPRNAVINVTELLVSVMLIILVLHYRRPVARFLGGAEAPDKAADGAAVAEPVDGAPAARLQILGMLRRRLADIWHVLAIAYLVVVYLVFALGIPGGFSFMMRATIFTVLLIIAASLATVLLGAAVGQASRPRPGTPARSSAIRRRTTVYLPIVERIGRFAITVVAIFVFLQIWGISSFEWLEGEFGNQLFASTVSIVLVGVGAIVVWEMVSSLIDRRLSRAAASEDAMAQTARLRTLLPLLRNVLMIVLVTVSALIALSEIGIDIAPLLAGAGVIGLAIGFGAQTLVKDVITGLFNLAENTIQVGDVVNVAGNGGLVEGLTIRAVRLRDLAGNLYTIPFSEVTTVMNMTRDFSFYVFDIGVAYREDMDHVIEVVKELGQELQEDPTYAPAILEPIEILGVDAFADSAVILKARFKTRPIKQWFVGREFNRRMKKRFDELGIEIPFPHTTIYFGVDKKGQAPGGNINVMAPDLVEALTTRAEGADETGGDRDASTDPSKPPHRKPGKSTFETPDQPGDSPAESDSSS